MNNNGAITLLVEPIHTGIQQAVLYILCAKKIARASQVQTSYTLENRQSCQNIHTHSYLVIL